MISHPTCFSCLDPRELIWSQRGLSPIGSVVIGDQVLDRHGRLQRVYYKRVEQKPVWELCTGSFRFPLRLAEGHACFVIRKSEVDEKIPFISYCETAKPKGHYRGDLRRNNPCRRSHPNNPVTVSELHTHEIGYGDFLLFPVVCDSERNTRPLFARA